MKVNDKIMYHYHKMGIYDDVWKKDNELIVDNNFISNYGKIINSFNTAVHGNPDGHLMSFDRVLNYYLDEKNITEIDKKLLIKILNEAREIIVRTNVYNRERALEEYRKNNCPNLPSRLNSLWVTDKKSLSFWRPQLEHNNDLILFKVLLKGFVFKSSDVFIPDDYLTVLEMYEAAQKYWNPIFETKQQKNSVEYLFQGKVKILEKIK